MDETRTGAERRLMNKAIHYLGRYTASQQRLRDVLLRFAARKLDHHEPATIETALERVVADCIRYGYIDDTAFALSQARSRRRAGKSGMAIRRALAQHAIEDDLVTDALAAADDDFDDGELAAALRHAARRRLGPYFSGEMDHATWQRQLASFARSGFALSIARQVMDLDSAEDADAMTDSLRKGRS